MTVFEWLVADPDRAHGLKSNNVVYQFAGSSHTIKMHHAPKLPIVAEWCIVCTLHPDDNGVIAYEVLMHCREPAGANTHKETDGDYQRLGSGSEITSLAPPGPC